MTTNQMIAIVVPIASVTFTLAGGLLITTRVTDRWDQIKKARDRNLTSVEEFQRLYGEFFELWKQWDTASRFPLAPDSPATLRWTILIRAAAVEGGVEALLVKVASERTLTDDELLVLGSVRQAFKSLRLAIRAARNLDWRASNSRQYEAFKGLAVFAVQILARNPTNAAFPSPSSAARQLRVITDNSHESNWVKAAASLRLVEASS